MTDGAGTALPRSRRLVFAAIALVVLLGAGGFVATQWLQGRAAPTASEASAAAPALEGDRVVFRSTVIGPDYGLVAAVPITEPTAPRTLSALACDRVDATDERTVCLRARGGIATVFEALELDAQGEELRRWPLSGIPSRTRIDPVHGSVATTAFVAGHSYASIGFSTETRITDADGTDSGNLEEFSLMVAGQRVTAVDRNIWGVSFTGDGTTFYATAASDGRTWLVRGDLTARTLTAVREGVECPSLSPDGTRIAFKSAVAGSPGEWRAAVLDLADGAVRVLPGERSVDDQLEWLDDDTVLYGLLREGAPGDADVWSVPADGSASPRLFIEHAWSPAVVRGQ